jgi:hypothetical protein
MQASMHGLELTAAVSDVLLPVSHNGNDCRKTAAADQHIMAACG